MRKKNKQTKRRISSCIFSNNYEFWLSQLREEGKKGQWKHKYKIKSDQEETVLKTNGIFKNIKNNYYFVETYF